MLSRFERPRDAVPSAFDGASFVSEQRGFVYLCVPKTLSRAMLGYLSTTDPDGFRAFDRGYGVEVLGQVRDATRFTFVRNPYSRIVALHFDKFVNYQDSPGQRALFGRDDGLRPDMSVTELAEWLTSAAGSDRRVDAHFLSQHYFVLDADGIPAVDLVGRTESADDDVAELQKALGLDAEPLPTSNRNADRGPAGFDTSTRWSETLDDHAIRLLTARYDGDFELFGYPRLPYRVSPSFSRRPPPPPRPRTVGTRLRSFVARRILRPLGVEIHRRRPDRPGR